MLIDWESLKRVASFFLKSNDKNRIVVTCVNLCPIHAGVCRNKESWPQRHIYLWDIEDDEHLHLSQDDIGLKVQCHLVIHVSVGLKQFHLIKSCQKSDPLSLSLLSLHL